uniref:Ig-like domain-containing protein n=1 Tax=Astyanax mexicanus TaxID=7994 RepID=A0A8B9H1G2_ASTMX
MQSKNCTIYDCTAVTLLNDRQIDFYNSSSDKPRTAKQNWMKNISESDWKTITEKLQSDRSLLNKLLDIQMDESGHSNSDGHVLQWRHRCAGERQSDGSVTVSRSINEFAYDEEELVNYNCTSNTWYNSDNQKKEEIEKLSAVLMKKCSQCEEMLKIFLQHSTFNITPSQSPPAVHVFSKKSVHDSSKQILTCLATGFYPKDVKMSLRKSGTSLPEHLITSSAVRPNDDETYQLRKSVEIQEDDPADYDCYVNHSSLQTPVIKQWDKKCSNWTDGRSWTGLIIVLILVVLVFICVLIYKKPQCVKYSSAPSGRWDCVW